MLRPYLPLLLLACCAWSCTDSLEDLTQIDEVRYTSEFAIPLVDSEVNLADIVGDVSEDVSVSIDPDRVLRFRYTGEVPAVGSDVIFARLETLAEGIFIPIVRNRQAAPFGGTEEIDLEELVVSGGELNYALPNTYDRPVRVRLSIDEARLDGVPFSVTGELPAYGGSGDPPTLNNLNAPLPMEDYVISVPEDSIYINYTIEDLQGNSLEIPEGTVISLRGLTFRYAEGYFGQAIYEGIRDTVAVDFFDRYLEGDIYFVDPTVTVTLTSSFGVPTLAQVEVLQIEDVNGAIIPIEGVAVDSGFSFDFPRTVGETEVTRFVFNRENSNIDEVLSARPIALDYRLNALLNPDNDTSIVGFLTDSSFYRARVDVELPLYGNANDFTLRDTFEIDITQNLEDIQHLTFRLTSYNDLPVNITLRGSFLDAAGNVVADLTDGESLILESAAVDADGNTTGRVRSSNDYAFDRTEIDAILAANRLVLEFDIDTAEEGMPFVRISEEQRLQVLVGALINVRQN